METLIAMLVILITGLFLISIIAVWIWKERPIHIKPGQAHYYKAGLLGQPCTICKERPFAPVHNMTDTLVGKGF